MTEPDRDTTMNRQWTPSVIVDLSNPSRELDYLVAATIMGWKDDGCGALIVNLAMIPAYSTSIAAAWEVVEKLRGQEILLTLWEEFQGDRTQWFASLNPKKLPSVGSCPVCNIQSDAAGPSPALAICLAALKAAKKWEI